MITTDNTQKRVLDLIRNGAELVFHQCGGIDGCVGTYKIGLRHNCVELTLSNPPDYEPFAEDFLNAICPFAYALTNHPEIKQAYNYRGDYDRRWQDVFVYIDTPEPGWVKSQIYDIES